MLFWCIITYEADNAIECEDEWQGWLEGESIEAAVKQQIDEIIAEGNRVYEWFAYATDEHVIPFCGSEVKYEIVPKVFGQDIRLGLSGEIWFGDVLLNRKSFEQLINELKEIVYDV